MLLALTGRAEAATVTIAASVDADHRTVRGTMTVDGLDGAELIDALERLPEPGTDLTLFRTYPNRPDQGDVRWTRDGDRIRFSATLPRRFGATGSTRAGLFANGGWYPVIDGLPVVDWVVDVTVPAGSVGALGDQVSQADQVHWEGRADRASLAVVRRGRTTPLSKGTLVTRGRPRRRLVRELEHDLASWPTPLAGVVVEGPLRRRLVRPGAGLAYVSDRAYRLTPGLQFAHRVPVARGIGAAWSGRADPFERELQGAGLSIAHQRVLGALEADEVLGVFAWVPQVQSLLASRRMAFYADILNRAWPGDPLQDDLAEVLRPSTPGTAAAAQLDDRFGPGTAEATATALAEGAPLAEALPELPGLLRQLRTPPPRSQDYRLEVLPDAVLVTRDAPPDALTEVVVVRIDGEDRPIFASPGTTRIPLASPARRVALDPEWHTWQRSRRSDTWPPRYTVTASGWISTLNLSQGLIYGTLYGSLRKQYDTRRIWSGTLSNSRADLVRVALGHTWKVGPLVDGFARRHAVRLGGSTSLLDRRFAPTEGLGIATDAVLSWRWDTRVSYEFPLSGERVSAAVTGGTLPGTSERWGGLNGGVTLLGGLSPRVVVATRLSGAMARSTVPHRLLQLGGLGAMRSIPVLPACSLDAASPCAVLATERGVVALEYRWAALRNLSVPLLLAWGSELQLTGGFEAVAASVEGEVVTASGVTAGFLGVGDVLGAEQMGLGATLGWTLGSRALGLEPSPAPQVYLRMSQAF